MITFSWALVAGLLMVGCATVLPQSADAASSCPATPPSPELSLPHLKAALSRGEEGVIVALGSSSTKGAMASDPGRTYPAELQSLLSGAMPNRHIAVLNRGTGGQDAKGELERIAADVIAVRPQLVIWQVGANGALRTDDPVLFRDRVAEGVRELQAADIDVILMDNQRSPKLLASALNQVFDETLASVARETGVGLFSRDRLMTSWEEGGSPEALFVAQDNLHLNDLGYRCIARSLATAIMAAVTPPSLSASR